MTGRDFRTGSVREEFFKESVAGTPAGALEVSTTQSHILSAHKVLAAQLSREFPHERLVRVRVGTAQAVVQVHRCDRPFGK